jgi:iron(III) transport system permease protein
VKTERSGAGLLLLLTAGIFAVFFLWPLLESLRGAFVDVEGRFTLAYVQAVFENPVYLLGFRNSLLVALGSTVLAAALGIPLALIFTRLEFPGRRVLAVLIPLPLFVPPFVGALGVQRLLGPTGALNAALAALGLVHENAPIDWKRDGRYWAVVSLTALHH